MAGKKRRFLIIPIVLNLLAFAAIPSTFASLGYLKGAALILAALIFPWILFGIWSAVFTSVIKEEIRELDEERERDFV